MRGVFFIVFFVTLSVAVSLAQSNDSLLKAIQSSAHDSVKCKLLIRYGELLVNGDPDSASSVWDKALAISRTHLGQKNSSVRERRFFMNSFSIALHNIAFIQMQKGDIEKALAGFHESLKMREQLGDKKEMAGVLNSIGMVHHSQGELDKALDYFLRSLKLLEELGDVKDIAGALNNIAYIYETKSSLEKAMECYNRSLSLRRSINDEAGIAVCLNNLGFVYNRKGDVKKAVELFEEALRIREKIGDKKGVAKVLSLLTGVYLERKDYSAAHSYNERSMQISKELGFPDLIRGAAKNFYLISKARGDYKNSLFHYRMYIQMRDSIKNEDNRNAAIRNQMQYEYEKKLATDSVEHARQSEVDRAQFNSQQSELHAKRIEQYFLFGGLTVLIAFAVVLIKRFRLTSRQKQVIELQKALVEEKQKEILDSIHYAKRIQSALMTSERNIGMQLRRLRGKSR